MQKSIPYLWPKRLKKHTLWGRTYLYSPYKGVPTPGWHSPFNQKFWNFWNRSKWSGNFSGKVPENPKIVELRSLKRKKYLKHMGSKFYVCNIMKIMRLLSFLEIPKNAVPFATGYFWEFQDFLVEWKAMYPFCPKRGGVETSMCRDIWWSERDNNWKQHERVEVVQMKQFFLFLIPSLAFLRVA